MNNAAHVAVQCTYPTTTGSYKDISLDVTKHLLDVTGTQTDNISSFSWRACPADGIELDNDFINGNVIGTWVKSTRAATFYRLFPTFITTQGRIIEDPPIGLASSDYSC